MTGPVSGDSADDPRVAIEPTGSDDSGRDLSHGAGDGLRIVADDRGFLLGRGFDPDTAYDLVINGVSAWSLVPARDLTPRPRGYRTPWPKAFRRFLRGHAHLAVHPMGAPEALASTDVVFAGPFEGPIPEVSVRDEEGNALILDKWGRLTRPLAAESPEAVADLLTRVRDLIRTLQEQAGVPAFVCYGTLLGAVRNGALIGHDNDVDIAYASLKPHPVDVMIEGFAVERVLKAAGWHVRRGSGTRLNVRIGLPNGTMRFVDIFTAHWVDGVLYMPSDTGFRLPTEVVLPLTTVQLEGIEMPAPGRSDELLEATYGAGWRAPDPSFKYETPRWLARQLGGWFGGQMTRRKHWDGFYSKSRDLIPDGPSRFAQWMMTEHQPSGRILDVGTGNGRDALFFAAEGLDVLGVDYSLNAIAHCERRAARKGSLARFEPGNLYDDRMALALGARMVRKPGPTDVYARFTVHDLDPKGQANLLRLARMSTRSGGRFFAEFRTPADAGTAYHFGAHRRFLTDPEELAERIVASGGQVLWSARGSDFAPLGEERPQMARLVATWSMSAGE